MVGGGDGGNGGGDSDDKVMRERRSISGRAFTTESPRGLPATYTHTYISIHRRRFSSDNIKITHGHTFTIHSHTQKVGKRERA